MSLSSVNNSVIKMLKLRNKCNFFSLCNQYRNLDIFICIIGKIQKIFILQFLYTCYANREIKLILCYLSTHAKNETYESFLNENVTHDFEKQLYSIPTLNELSDVDSLRNFDLCFIIMCMGRPTILYGDLENRMKLYSRQKPFRVRLHIV